MRRGDEREADALVDAQLQRTVREESVAERVRLDAGMWGSPAGRRQLRESAINADSEPERLFARALARRGFRLPANYRLGKFYVDLFDELSDTVFEIDGRAPHSERTMFRKDRRRQNALIAAGYYIQRYAADDVIDHVDEVADEAVALLRRRRKNRRPPR